MKIHIRKPTEFDAAGMADLLNEIIQIGGTTAYTQEITSAEMKAQINSSSKKSNWVIATDDSENCLGFQWIAPRPNIPAEACDIATFVKAGQTGLGIGSKLFDATRRAAEDLGYEWINANIRSDNESGLTYYQSRGFRTYGHLENQKLENGQLVQKTLKRFDLKD